MLRIQCSVLVALLLCSTAHADMFSCTYSDGRRVLTNVACDDGGKQQLVSQAAARSYTDVGGVRSYYQSVYETPTQYVTIEPKPSGDPRSDAQKARSKELIERAQENDDNIHALIERQHLIQTH